VDTNRTVDLEVRRPGESPVDEEAQFTIREARASDRVRIGVLWRELMTAHRALDKRFVIAADGQEKYARHVHEMIRSRDARVLVAQPGEGGEPIGYLLGEIQMRAPIAMPGAYGFVSDVYVVESWRHRGVGTALVVEACRWFAARKAVSVELYVADANPSAHAFWRSMGFEPFLRLMHLELPTA
jgi:ribosomal protein S18 acetylase RimI-like enzyme